MGEERVSERTPTPMMSFTVKTKAAVPAHQKKNPDRLASLLLLGIARGLANLRLQRRREKRTSIALEVARGTLLHVAAELGRT